jgi:WD40 repeat protein
MRVLAWVVAAAALGVALPSAAGALPGDQLWLSRYNGSANQNDSAAAVAVSPDGSRVFVTGESDAAIDDQDYATVAYDAVTGAQLWATRYDGPASTDIATAIGVSPDGSRVFVTGYSYSGYVYEYTTIAYDAATGFQQWVRRYNGGRGGYARALAVSPDGSKVFVTGGSVDANLDYATVAYDAASGTQLWVGRYDGPGTNDDEASALVVGPGGRRVFVTGFSAGSGTGYDYATVAYSIGTGKQLWVSRYNGPGEGADYGNAIGISPDRTKVFVTGESPGSGTGEDYATLAYDAATGAQLWERRYNGPGNAQDIANAIAVSPSGPNLFVTGYGVGLGGSDDYATVAYDQATGTKVWVRRYNGPGRSYDLANALGASPDGSTVFVTGQSIGSGGGEYNYDFATLAYDAATGSRLWLERYNGPGNDRDEAFGLGIAPDGSRLFVTGFSAGSGSGYDYATIAYSTG